MGRRIVERIEDKSYELGVRREQIEFILWLHEIGRLVNPHVYLKDELIDLRLLKDFGIPKRITDMLLPLNEFKKAAISHNAASSFFSKLTPAQRIVNLADNFGKRDGKGKLFDLKSLSMYLKTERSRYGANLNWKPEYDLLQEETVEKTIAWLAELGVDFAAVLKELHDYGPKFVIVVRHGELDNPKNIVYNLDEVMMKEDIIHISDYGRKQLEALGRVILKKKFKVGKFRYSNQTRAVESAQALNKILKVKDFKIESRLRDAYAPGGYLEGMKMDEIKKNPGFVYDNKNLNKYNHEKPQDIVRRITKVFTETVKTLEIGNTAILLSHGDPIAWWINNQVSGKLPKPKELRNLIYPNKGEAIVVVIDPQEKFFTYYFLTDPTLKKGKMY